MQIWKLILLLVLVLAVGSSATSDSTSAPSEATEHYLQAVVWEQHMIFNNVLEWAVQKGVLTPSQFGTIQSELAKRLEDVSENEGTDVLARRMLYSFISSRLSVPSLLAGFGLILLFSLTVAAVVFYFSSPIVLVISLAGMGMWLWISVGLGQSLQWQVLGVCISVIPAALASTASYGFLMLIGLPNSPYEFLLPEISTIIFSLVVYYKYNFTFLLVPALIAGYFMWVDITCILSGKTWRIDPMFPHASWLYGLATILFGVWRENDASQLGFWFYLVGGFTFVGGLLPFILLSADLINEVAFLTSVAAMVYAGTTAQRSILLIYGLVGITIYVTKSAIKIANVTPAAVYVRALFSVLFFSLSVVRFTHSAGASADPDIYKFTFSAYAGFAEYGCGFWLLILHTLSWLPHVSAMQPTSRSRVIYFIAHLFTSIGLVGLSQVMNHMSYGIIKIIYDVHCGTIVSFIAGIGLLLNHCSALILDIGLSFGPRTAVAAANAARNGISSIGSAWAYPASSPSGDRKHMIVPGAASAPVGNTNFRRSRVLIIVLVGLLSYVIPTSSFARSSVIALLFLVWIEFIYKSPNLARKMQLIAAQFTYSTLAFLVAHLFDLSYLRVACIACMFVWTNMAAKALKPSVYWLLVTWMSLFLALGSPLIFAVFAISLAMYFVHLGKWAKLNRQSKTRGLALFGLVATVLISSYVWLNLDAFLDVQHLHSHQLRHAVFDAWQNARPYADNLFAGSGISLFKMSQNVATFLAWPLPLTDALVSDGSYILIIIILIGSITAISEGATWLHKKYWAEVPIDEDLPPIMSIGSMTVHFPVDTNQNGIVLGLKGAKSQVPFDMDNASLYIIGDEFWNTLSVMYGAAEIDAYRKANYPFKLFPNRLSKKHFKSADPQMWLQFGTGSLKEPPFSQSNIRSTLRKLVAAGDSEFTIRVIYSARKQTPKNGVLFEFDIRPGLILNSIREGITLAPILTDW